MNRPQRRGYTEKESATDMHRFAQIRDCKIQSVSIRVHLWLMSGVSLCLCVSVAFLISSTRAQQNSPTPVALEGCLKCHAQIEPMHKFGPTQTLDKLDNGKDALGLTCTSCHGGNPVATEKGTAHARPRFPRALRRQGKFAITDGSAAVLNRGRGGFVRFPNPPELPVAGR